MKIGKRVFKTGLTVGDYQLQPVMEMFRDWMNRFAQADE